MFYSASVWEQKLVNPEGYSPLFPPLKSTRKRKTYPQYISYSKWNCKSCHSVIEGPLPTKSCTSRSPFTHATISGKGSLLPFPLGIAW